jgi:hypothetical protein
MKNSSSSPQKSLNILIILPKLFLIISVLLLLWIVILISGVSYLELDPDWAGISISIWLLVISVLFGAFIVIDILMYMSPTIFMKGEMQEFIPIEPSSEYLDGMKVYEYTYPRRIKGGLFSKTYVKVDDSTLIRVRNQMIPAEVLWSNKTKEKDNDKEE